MARTISLELNDTSEAAIEWAISKINSPHADEKDYVPVSADDWIKMKAAEVINGARVGQINELAEQDRIKRLQDAGLA